MLKFWNHFWVCLIIKYNVDIIIRNWWLKNLGVACYPCIQIRFDLIIDFWIPFSSFNLVHRIFPTLIALRFDFTDSTRRFSVLFLTSNMLVNKLSDFLALGFLTIVWVIRKPGLTSVTSYGLETIPTSRISFRFCWSSHLPACWYIFLCYSNICVQQKACFLMLGKYQ